MVRPPDLDAAANRRLPRPPPTGEGVVDDRDLRSGGAFRLVELAPLPQRDVHQPEVSRLDAGEEGHRHFVSRRDRDGRHRVEPVTTPARSGRAPGRRHADGPGDRAQRRRQAAIEPSTASAFA